VTRIWKTSKIAAAKQVPEMKTIECNSMEEQDEALARSLQMEWNNENNDEMLALLLQEETERRRREERFRRQKERMLRMQRELRRARSLDPRFVDVDRMSYEELLALEERIGNVKSFAATKEEIQVLPVSIVEECDNQEEVGKCSICLGEFEKGNTLKTLPCFHQVCEILFFLSHNYSIMQIA